MIRNLVLTDSVVIQKLNHEELGYDYPINKTNTNIKKLLSDPKHHFILVFEDENTHQVVGYVHAQLYEETYSDTLFNILALAVNNSFQHKGIGKKLMLAIEEKAKELNITAIRLNSGEERTAAYRFYEKIGYTCNKKQKRFSKQLIIP
ncbi:GNAT family N-acetyltransferase [Ligilactobacillus sp. WILCCON 0076]|uniref:GNAT family N-acetyltransferase n=1 Tax=Ligilactobacillus ubinensis TaxID=2876789 RepID=A0A9X2JPN7_9LACO|nr:GNAT family N-acetyltransferase [Ligilactobacillus ubinensis]MCP0887986.1 GNAT family N-acetyltransferase [Ligilactobacillus ubinensis]